MKPRGYRPNPPDHRAPNFRRHPACGAAPVAPSADNRGICPAVMTQQTSSCTAHAVACASFPALQFVLSQADNYKISRSLGGELNPDGTLQDGGAAPADVIQAMQVFGVRKCTPIGTNNSDDDPATVGVPESFLDLETDAKCVVVGQYAVTNLDDAKRALAAGKLVTGAIFVDTQGPRSVEGWDPSTGPLAAPDTNDAAGGGHYICLTGYQTAADGTTTWTFQNSWSTAWGLAGYGLGGDAWAEGLTGLYVFDIHVVEAA